MQHNILIPAIAIFILMVLGLIYTVVEFASIGADAVQSEKANSRMLK